MKSRHKSYKLQDDSLEATVKELQSASADVFTAKEKLNEIAKQYKEAKSQLDFLEVKKIRAEQQVLELLNRQHRKSVVVDKIKYSIDPTFGTLRKELLL